VRPDGAAMLSGGETDDLLARLVILLPLLSPAVKWGEAGQTQQCGNLPERFTVSLHPDRVSWGPLFGPNAPAIGPHGGPYAELESRLRRIGTG
ncbi:MAG: hypothetical protein ACP5XB_06350, partial [Isosphaeraceae bacterium]